jgi:hypothetical protein
MKVKMIQRIFPSRPPPIPKFRGNRENYEFDFGPEKPLLLSFKQDCPESYCHDPGVGVGVTPQGKSFNLGYIF